jgi:hypothetical protein
MTGRNSALGFLLGLLLIVLALLAGQAASEKNFFFDPDLQKQAYPCSWIADWEPRPLNPGVEDWLSVPLREIDEPSLYRQPPTDGTTTLRFTFIPSFSPPIAMRIDDLHGPRPRFTATRVLGQIRLVLGPNRQTRELSPSEVQPIIDHVGRSQILDLMPDSCITGIDGGISIIESAGPDGYRFINRWGVHHGPVHELGWLMYQLTGWPEGDEGAMTDLYRQAPLAAGT